MIIVETPLRLSFNGGGTDFEDFYKDHGGAVFSTAIDKSVFVIVKERFDNKIYLNWSKKEIVDRVDDIEHELIRSAMILTGVTQGVEITTLSDVPSEGSGLGSSSSITVALLHALHTYKNRLVTADQLAEEACQIEIDMLKKPIGKQDQYIAAYGGMRLITFSKKSINVHDVCIPSNIQARLNEHLLLIYVGNTRKSSTILQSQKANIPINLEALKHKTSLAYQSRRALEESRLEDLGLLLGQGMDLKRQINPEATNKEIDCIYQMAKNTGAIGGKIVGAGGEGFILLYVPMDKRVAVRHQLGHLQELPFHFSPDGSRVIFNRRK